MTVLRPRIDWRSLDRAALGEAYNSAAAVANCSAITASWEPRSTPVRLTIGMNVALVGYTLAPAASMDEIVAEIGSALDWLTAELPALDGHPEKLLLSGWSAGAQLAAMNMHHPSVRGCLAISGIYDLEPMRHCYVNDKLGLDEAMALRNSPIRLQPSAKVPLAIVVGGAELPLMRQQSADYAGARSRQGLPALLREIPSADHFSILDEMERSDGLIVDILRQLQADAGL
jgi:arylformamidase